MKRKLFIGVIIVIAVTGGLGLVKALQIKKLIASKMTPPPETAENWRLPGHAAVALHPAV